MIGQADVGLYPLYRRGLKTNPLEKRVINNVGNAEGRRSATAATAKA